MKIKHTSIFWYFKSVIRFENTADIVTREMQGTYMSPAGASLHKVGQTQEMRLIDDRKVTSILNDFNISDRLNFFSLSLLFVLAGHLGNMLFALSVSVPGGKGGHCKGA